MVPEPESCRRLSRTIHTIAPILSLLYSLPPLLSRLCIVFSTLSVRVKSLGPDHQNMSSLDTSMLMRAGPSLPIPIGAGTMIGCIRFCAYCLENGVWFSVSDDCYDMLSSIVSSPSITLDTSHSSLSSVALHVSHVSLSTSMTEPSHLVSVGSLPSSLKSNSSLEATIAEEEITFFEHQENTTLKRSIFSLLFYLRPSSKRPFEIIICF